MKKPKKAFRDPENPEWTKKMFARARPLKEMMPDLVASPPKRGRPKAEKPLSQISLRIDPDALATFKAQGRGWQKLARNALERESVRLRKSRKRAA
jgi:uncharacterized protein (DUF4415 family)